MCKIREVAKLLGVSETTVRVGLQKGIFPFGTAIKRSSRWTYILYPEKVREYIGCDGHG